MIDEQKELLLSIRRSLWGAITPALRMVTAEIKNDKYLVIFYYDGPISEFDYDLADTAVSESMADFVHNDLTKWTFDQEILRLDYPAKMPALEVVAYKRYEKPVEKKNLWNAIARIFSSRSN